MGDGTGASARKQAADKGAAGHRPGAVLLAAGESRRMGGVNKLLLRIDGVPLVRRQLDALLAAGITEVVVVLGHQAGRVVPLLPANGVVVVLHDAYRLGQQGSVLAGLAALSARADPVLVMLGDLPLLEPADLSELLAAWEHRAEGCRAMIPVHAGRRGNPVVVERGVATEVLARGDARSGLRGFIDTHAGSVARFEAPSDHCTFDLDTPADIERLERRLGRRVEGWRNGEGAAGEDDGANAHSAGE